MVLGLAAAIRGVVVMRHGEHQDIIGLVVTKMPLDSLRPPDSTLVVSKL